MNKTSNVVLQIIILYHKDKTTINPPNLQEILSVGLGLTRTLEIAWIQNLLDVY